MLPAAPELLTGGGGGSRGEKCTANGRDEEEVDREAEGVTEAVAAAETEAEEEEEMERDRDDCARWWWREECKRREAWRASEREDASE